MDIAVVRELWRWPVKGMAGESMPSLRLDGRGVGGDRTHAVLGAPPTLAGWRAAYPFNVGANVDPASPPFALVTSPRERTYVWDDPRLLAALEDELGVPVRLRRDVHGLQRVQRTVLVACGDAGPPELRANVRLDRDPGLDRPGRVLEVAGGVRLRVLRAAPHGGAYARVLSGGRIAIGASVSAAGSR